MTSNLRLLMILLIVGILGATGSVLYGSHLQSQRVNDIQASRVASCQKTYHSFIDVFEPFFPPPKKQTPQQKKDLQKLRNVVNHLAATCSQQTQP